MCAHHFYPTTTVYKGLASDMAIKHACDLFQTHQAKENSELP